MLGNELRYHRISGFAFRRQVSIHYFIADFACHVARLVIELDGGQHFSDDSEHADARRSAAIEACGYRVLRFSSLDVMRKRIGVLEIIAATLAARAPLPRKRGRGGPVPD
jgi:very-short-patch-repair endonuclease